VPPSVKSERRRRGGRFHGLLPSVSSYFYDHLWNCSRRFRARVLISSYTSVVSRYPAASVTSAAAPARRRHVDAPARCWDDQCLAPIRIFEGDMLHAGSGWLRIRIVLAPRRTWREKWPNASTDRYV